MRRASRSFSRSVFVGLAALVAMGAASGCGKPQLIGGKPRPQRFARVVSLSPSTTEILGSYGAPLLGRTSADDYPDQVARVPVVAGVKPDYEAIARIKPDLVVYDAQLYNAADVRKIESLGATTLAYDPKDYAELEKGLWSIGSAIGQETQIGDYVSNVRQAMARASGTGDGLSAAIIMPDKGGRPMIAGSKGLLADFVRATGAKAVGPDSNRFVPLDPEFLVKEDPNVILLAGVRADFVNDPRFANLRAVRGLNVYGAPPNLILRAGAQLPKLMDNIAKAVGLANARIAQAAGSGAARP